MKKKTLDEIFNQYQTDKGSACKDCHNYAPVYSALFEPLRFLDIKLLEVGVRYGNSLLSWHEYFPNASIYAAETYAAHNDELFRDKPRIKIYLGDATQEGLVSESGFNIIIDDADHALSTQISLLETLWDKLLPGGFYVIEDLFVGEMPWGGFASEEYYQNEIDYNGHHSASDAAYIPKRPHDQPFLNRRRLPESIIRILDENMHFFTITSVGKGGSLHMMLVIRRTKV